MPGKHQKGQGVRAKQMATWGKGISKRRWKPGASRGTGGSPSPPPATPAKLPLKRATEVRRKSLRASPVEASLFTPQLEREHSGRCSRSVEKPDTTVGELAVGNRIISLEVLTEKLLPHARCPKCENWGTLTPSMGGERGQGLAGVLRFFCRRCDKLTLDMPTSVEQVRGHKCGPAQAGLNLRACLAAVHCGIGYEHVCRFMGLMNLPAPAESTYQRAEDKMYKVMLEVGAESMQRADLQSSSSVNNNPCAN